MLTAAQITEVAHEAGDVLHHSCTCCEHAAKRTVGLREAIANAISMIEGGFPGETMFELDRVLVCLNEWCNAPTETPAIGKTEDDQHPF